MLIDETDSYRIEVYWGYGSLPTGCVPMIRLDSYCEHNQTPVYYTTAGAKRLMEALAAALLMTEILEQKNDCS